MAAEDFSDLIPRFDLRGMDLQLDRMHQALHALGSPCADIPAIQIAGTNGKGSIASFLSAALQQAGINCGVTTSPHLVSWCERIVVQGTPITPQRLRQLLEAQQQITQDCQLTPFEQLLAAAFAHFQSNAVDLLVLEVGLGGRLDATTAHRYRPVIALASIGLDHCEHLGTSLNAIASEKAAVINAGATVISASQPDAVQTVLEQTCREANADLRWVEPLDRSWDLGLAGDLQRTNAAVARGALQALHPLGWSINDQTMRQGFAQAQWNGRLQTVVWQGHPLLVDGAHNPPAAQQLALERHRWSGQAQGQTWILGIQAHKQALEMIEHLLLPVDRAWIVPVPGHRSWSRSSLVEAVPRWREQLKQADSAVMALEAIQGTGSWPQPMPVLAGSLYLIGDLLACGAIQAK
ncbi:MAG: Mur ligase family protein [Cyanobacteriota bacterium]|nr:Mur ligase family protein [Cyanobacteriota bacterium]